jgi:hypothetical protein
MKKDYITKTLGGLTIMFSVFLFFAATKQLSYQNEQLLANISASNARKEILETTSAVKNDGVITGNFNTTASRGNVSYFYDEEKTVRFDYQGIKSDELKNDKLVPVLKLEQREEGENVWKETKWSWIDYDQGILYFHYQTEENGEIQKVADFTGKYQIILN